MSKRKRTPGLTAQGVKNLDFIKGKPRGIRLPLPPDDSANCDHLGTVVENSLTGAIYCTQCHQVF